MDTGCTYNKLSFAQSSSILIGALLYGQTVYAAEQVAIVIASEGKVTANARDLARRSSIYQGETINTATGGKVAFKFTDGSVVTLKENSSYAIKNYSFNQSQKPDNFDAHLLKGGLKTVTGKIGKEAQHTQDAIEAGIPVNQQVKVSNYKVKAAIATIGVRGTSYKCVIKDTDDDINSTDNDKILLSATSGGITADFADESMDLGVGAVAAYAEIDADGSSAYLSSDPIPDSDFDIASGDDEDDEGGDDSDDDDDDEGDDEDDGDDEGGDDEGGDDEGGDDSAGDDSGSDSE